MPVNILKRVRPLFRYLLAGFIVLSVVFLWTLPVMIEYYIEKHDKEWFGRELEMEDIDLYLFSGKMVIEGLTLFEKDSEQAFVSLARAETNVAMLSLMRPLYEFDYLLIQSPVAHIRQNGEIFNFDDLLALTGSADSAAADEPTEYIIRNIQLSDGKLSYEDIELSALIELENIDATVPVLDYRDPKISYDLHMFQKQGGELTIGGLVNWEEYINFNKIGITDWALYPYQNYLTSYLNIKHFDAALNGDFRFGGNYSESGYVASSGTLDLNDFELVDARGDSLLQVKATRLKVDTVNTAESLYDVDYLVLDQPSVLFKYYESTDNFTSLYMDTLSTETLDTVRLDRQEVVFENPFQYVSDQLRYFVNRDVLDRFEIDSALIAGGHINFQDYSNLEEAVIVMDDFHARLDGVTRTDSLLKVTMQSKVNKFGNLYGDLALDRSTLTDFTFTMDVENFYISAFDPYSKHYTAHPVWEGNLNISSSTTVYQRQLNSSNHLLIIQPEVGKKLDADPEYNIPLRFAFGLLKDVEGNVELELPIEGNLDDPEYKVGKVILKVLMNVLSKAVASPYKLLARTFDADEEDLRSVRFDPDQDSLAAPQLKSLNLLSRVLENKEDLKASLEYALNEKEEKDALALKQIKEQFINGLSDSLASVYPNEDAVDNADSLFVSYLQDQTGAVGSMTVPQMCRDLVGEEQLNERIARLREIHQTLVRNYLFEEKEFAEDRIVILESEDQEKISSVLRPTFFINFDATDYQQPDSVAGPEPLVQPQPVAGN